MTHLTKLMTLSLAPLLALHVGCAGESEDDPGSCTGAKCDDLDKPDEEVEDSPCDGVIHDMSGRGHEKVAGRLNDPFAQMVLRSGDGCPTTFADIMDKLRELDTDGCSPDDPRAGITTRLVTETAQAAGTPTDYRAVTSRKCGGRDTHGILFSLFGVRADATSLPANVEVMAFDETTGVFNYYETDGNELQFFGNSNDMLKGADGQVRRCASCHTGGGMIMKELHTPWLHWEGHMDTPGAAELVSAHEDLGTKATGAEFEGVVKSANRIINETRLGFVKESGTPADVLRPLFCTVEVNLDNGADFESPVAGGPGGSEMSRIPADSLLDPQLKSFGSISITFDDYDALIKANGQQVPGVSGAIDTVFDYAFIERSEADNDYVNKLKAAGIVDDELIKDILMVDMTRPIFSDERCDLLRFVPQIPNADLTAESVRDGLIANIGSPIEGTPEAELLANLQNDGGHSAKVEAFLDACEALGSAALLANAMAITSLNRDIARTMHVFEFPATMPDDDQEVPMATRLHPATCELTTEFTPVPEPSTPE